MAKWIVEWNASIFGDKEYFDSFEEAKSVFRRKISREIDVRDELEMMEEQLEEESNEEEIISFLNKFLKNEIEKSDIIEAEYNGDFNLKIDSEHIDISEDEDFGEQTFPTISSDFILMDDSDRSYCFQYIDYYDPNMGINPDFSGFQYYISLRKVDD